MGVPLEDPSLCQLLRKRYTLEGSLDRHHFDVVVGNGIPYFAAQALSFEFPDLTTLKKTMDATAWTVADVLEQTQQDGDSLRAVDVSPLDPDLLDATVRLARLLGKPNEYRALSPLVIVYRLLTGAQGSRMRHLAIFGGHAHRMVRAVQKLSQNFDQSVRIENIARELGMSVSGFHAQFKAVTAMSPLQFQKQLRLQAARRMMLNENLDAAEAGYRVGYDDASHFSREYKRHFGAPPIRDVERLRELAGPAAPR